MRLRSGSRMDMRVASDGRHRGRAADDAVQGIAVQPAEKTIVVHCCKRQGCTFVSTDPDVVIRHSIRECTAAFASMGEPREAE